MTATATRTSKKQITFRLQQQTCKYITLFGTFSCRSFHYDLKFQNTTMDFPFSCWTWIGIQLQAISLTIVTKLASGDNRAEVSKNTRSLFKWCFRRCPGNLNSSFVCRPWLSHLYLRFIIDIWRHHKAIIVDKTTVTFLKHKYKNCGS